MAETILTIIVIYFRRLQIIIIYNYDLQVSLINKYRKNFKIQFLMFFYTIEGKVAR